MRYLAQRRFTRVLALLLTSSLAACGGGGSGGGDKTSTASSTATLSSLTAISSLSSAIASSSATPNPVDVTSLTLGAPTTNPIVIPPSASAVPVKFLSVVRGNYYPEKLLLDEVDKNGAVVRASVALLNDDGRDGDAFRGDQIYSGQLPLGSVASVEKAYRVHADHKGTDVVSGTGRFWVSGCPSVARPSNPDKAILDTTSNAYVFADEVLVTLSNAVAPELSEINAIMADAKGQVVGCIPALNQYLVEVPDSTTAASLYAAIATLKSKTTEVVEASPNAVILSPPSDNEVPCTGDACQWYLERIRAPQAWALVGGGDQQMGVGVIDFGVDCKRSDLNCNGGANSEDTIDHGTGVASLIAAHKGDNASMVGVAWNTALYPFSFIGRGGSQYKMSELITLSMAEESIRVINISAATATDPSSQIRDAMCSAIDSGRLIVAAAGNATTAKACQLESAYPARYNSSGSCSNGADLKKGLLVVGAIDANNNLAQWENNSLCSNTLYVDVFAPGKDIYAASANSNGYAAKNGTSFASPLVAGSAAVLWAAQPSLTVSQVHDKLVASAVTYAKGTASTVNRQQTQDTRLEGKQLLDLFAAVGGKDTQIAPDLVPDAFAFTARSDTSLNAYINSERITIKGIDASIPISIEGGFYAIDNAPFTSAAGTVGPNQTVIVQLLSAALPLTRREATLTLGGLRQSFQVTTAAVVAAQASNFDFSDIANADLSSQVLSSPLKIAGLTAATALSIVGGDYSIDGGAFTRAPGSLSANQTLQLRISAASTPDTRVTATVTLGAISDSLTVTTVTTDISPDAFSFADSNNIAPSSLQTSNSISVKGINTAANISVSGGEYALDGGAFTAVAGKVKAGQTVSVRHKSSAQFAADTYTALTIGSYTATFRSHTSGNTAPTVSNISIQDINGGSLEVGDSLLGTYTYVDADNDPEGASSYRWLRNGVVIAGATTTTYVLTAADSGQDIRFEVTPVATDGIVAGAVKESPANPVVNSAPRISNLLITTTSGVVGDILRANYSYQDAENDLEGQSSYRWLRSGLAIAGATSASYQTVSSDAGQPLSVEVTPVALSGKLVGVAVVSHTILLGNTAPQANSVAISGATAGKSAVGASLTGTYVFADSDGDLEAVSRYRWLRNGTAIAGATSRTYLLTAADSGQSLVFEVTPIAADGSVQGTVVLSSAVAVNAVPSAQAVKVVDSNGGSLVVGDILTGSYGYLDGESDAQGVSRYRWLRNGTAIAGATAITYVLTPADSVQNIVFEVTPIAASGSVTGAAVQSVALSISNSAPVASNVRIVDSNGGSAALADTLNGTYSYLDSDGNAQGATTFRWYRNGTELVSSSQSYTLTAADSGKTLEFKVTPRATTGVLVGAEVASALLTVPAFTPNGFAFTAVTGVALSSVNTSNIITISGINTAVPVTIVNGQYAINGGAFTNAPGTISNGQTLALRVTASGSVNTSVQTVVTVGGLSSNFSVTTAVADTAPDAFSFPPVGNAALGSAVTSATVTISGINTAAPISISGGEYSLNGGAFVSSAGSVSNGQTLRVRVTAANLLSTTVQAVVTVGGVSGTFSVSTATTDTTPDAFSFASVSNAALNAVMTSNSITISGINTAVAISIVNGQYAINGGAFTSAAATVSNGQTVVVRVTASATPGTIMLGTLTVGGVTGTFAVGNVAVDTTPDAFSFSAISSAALSSLVTSNAVVIAGINSAATISIANGQYSINGGAFTAAAGVVSAGQTVAVRVTSSANTNTLTQSVLTVGGVAASFSVTTLPPDTSPDIFTFAAVTNATLATEVISNSVTISGINSATPIAVSGGLYSIGGGAFTNIAGTVSNGQTVRIKLTSSASNNTTIQAALNVGNISSLFRVTTIANHPPVIVQPSAINVNENTSQTSYIPSATDPEGDTFSFSLSGRDAGLFTLAANGALVFVSPPDFEAPKDDDANNIYQLNLMATDSKGGASQAAVTVNVKNETRHVKVSLLMPTPGSDVGRGTTTTTTVMCRFVDLESGNLAVTSATANGVPLAETAAGSGVWFAKIVAVAGQNSLNISANIPSEATPLVSASMFNNRGAMKSPQGLAVDQAKNTVYIIDGAHDSLLKADLTTGHRQVISDAQTWPNADVFWPGKMRLHNGNNNLLVTDSWGSGKLFNVNVTTGTRAVLARGVGAAAGVELNPTATHGLVANANWASILKVDLVTGVQTVAADASVGAGDPLEWPYDIKANASFDKYIVATQRSDSLLSFNPATGDRFMIASATVGSGATFNGFNAIVFNPAGNRIWVGDSRGVLDVDLTTLVRQRLLTTDFSITDLKLDSANNRLLLADRNNSTVQAMNNTTFAKTVFLDGSVGAGQHFTWARSVVHDAVGKYIYVGDINIIRRVELATGKREIFSGPGVGTGPLPSDVYDMYLDSASNQLYALSLNGLLRVNVATGNREVVTNSSVGSGPVFANASSLAVDATRNLAWFTDYQLDAIFQVNLITGERSILSDGTRGQGTVLNSPFAIVLDAARNRLLVGSESGIVAVNITSGNRTMFSNSANQGPTMRFAGEMSMDLLRNRVLVIADDSATNLTTLLAVDLTSGNRVAVSLNGALGTGPGFINTQGISVDGENNRVFMMDSGDGTGALLNISLTTGDRVIVSQ